MGPRAAPNPARGRAHRRALTGLVPSGIVLHMSRARLPESAEESWEGGFVFESAHPIIDLSGAGGLVMGCGDQLYMLRPGAETWKARPGADELGPTLAIAAEQRPPWRYAVACTGGVTMYGLPDDQKLTLRAQDSDALVTHMAFAAFGKESVLYLRWDDGSVGRLRMDLGTIEVLPVMPMDAIASDKNGVLAMVSVRGAADDAHAIFTRDGTRLEERPATPVPAGPDEGPETRVHMAVADAAIAYAVEGRGAHVSRGVDEDFAPCEALAPGGPLVFQGAAADAALFGVCWGRVVCSIHRVEAGGGVQRILELGGDVGDAPRIASIVWDASRRTLWSALPQAGIVRSEEPKGKGRKKRSLN
jgi:hypothetical protein